jgi:hypothetical protein
VLVETLRLATRFPPGQQLLAGVVQHVTAGGVK